MLVLVSVLLDVGIVGVTEMVLVGLAERLVVVAIRCAEAIEAIEKEGNLGAAAAIGASFGEGNFAAVEDRIEDRESIDALFRIFSVVQCLPYPRISSRRNVTIFFFFFLSNIPLFK